MKGRCRDGTNVTMCGIPQLCRPAESSNRSSTEPQSTRVQRRGFSDEGSATRIQLRGFSEEDSATRVQRRAFSDEGSATRIQRRYAHDDGQRLISEDSIQRRRCSDDDSATRIQHVNDLNVSKQCGRELWTRVSQRYREVRSASSAGTAGFTRARLYVEREVEVVEIV